MSKPARISTLRRSVVALAFVACSVALGPRPALAWGDEGHRIIALVAEQFLEPTVRERVRAVLAADPADLTAHDIASAATWADHYRDFDRSGSRQHYEQTRQWHFVDVELADPNLDTACSGHPPLPAGTVASNGPAQACVADKIQQVYH
jgi:hypothetical protein